MKNKITVTRDLLIDDLHPLLVQYVNAEKIELMEKEVTLIKMIGFCECNILTYKNKKVSKIQENIDLEIVEAYQNYLNILNDCMKYVSDDMLVVNALKLVGHEFRYFNHI